MSFSWDMPYPSARMPVLAKNVVATSQTLAAQSGLRMLLAGGNAVDAALATAIALTVVEPTSNGLGSDAFALVWDGERLHGLNGSGRSPRAWSFERFQQRYGEGAVMPKVGWDTVTIPGAVDAWARLSERFGRMPFADLFAPAIRYARDGFLVSPIAAQGWATPDGRYAEFSDFIETFTPDGRRPRAGELFRCEAQATTLDQIAETKGESFYRGRLATCIATHADETDGDITLEDLSEHASMWVEPVAQDYRGARLHEIPPNGQGIAALMALGILDRFDLARYPVDSADSLHLQIEAMKVAFAEAHRHVADPDSMVVAPDALLDSGFLDTCAEGIRMDRAAFPESSLPTDRGTVYLTAADEGGMMVSFIQSNYMGFGSGIVIPNTGISMQNRGCGFVIDEGHPNRVDGGKRPYHTIIPGFATRDGSALMSFGVMGGHMQPQGHVQMMVRALDYGQNPQAALDAPRWHVDEDLSLKLERGVEASVVDELARRGQRVTSDVGPGVFGGGQTIWRLEEGYCAASDPRKDGLAVGF